MHLSHARLSRAATARVRANLSCIYAYVSSLRAYYMCVAARKRAGMEHLISALSEGGSMCQQVRVEDTIVFHGSARRCRNARE